MPRVEFFYRRIRINVALQQIVEQTVSGLGYDLVEIERSAGGLLRVTIDLPWHGPVVSSAAGSAETTAVEPYITVEDCEKVNRQLQFALEVDGAEYRRLEISSPGIDRPLRHDIDMTRFVGELIDITLRQPVGSSVASGLVHANRKKFRGRLEAVEGEPGAPAAGDAAMHWRIVWSDEPERKPGHRVSHKRKPAPLQAMEFTLAEVRDARLAPVIDFSGRRPKAELLGNLLNTEGGADSPEENPAAHLQDRSDMA